MPVYGEEGVVPADIYAADENAELDISQQKEVSTTLHMVACSAQPFPIRWRNFLYIVQVCCMLSRLHVRSPSFLYVVATSCT